MSENYKITIVNYSNETIEERSMTESEIAEIEKIRNDVALFEKTQEYELTKKDAARKAIFEKLGITEEEAKLLLS